MDYTISLDASGNEVTTWNYPEPMCGDFPECHAEPPTCGCGTDFTEPPVGIVVDVRWWTLRENVAYTIQRIREARASEHIALEVLFTNDLRALLSTRGAR